MLQPARTKYRKAFKGPHPRPAKGGSTLNFGSHGLKAVEPERSRRARSRRHGAPSRAMKRAGRVWIRIFPDVPVTKKPAEVRMGSGKGAPDCGSPASARPHHVRARQRQ
jgi:large subunit ribosomal protein L16